MENHSWTTSSKGWWKKDQLFGAGGKTGEGQHRATQIDSLGFDPNDSSELQMLAISGLVWVQRPEDQLLVAATLYTRHWYS